MKISVITITFNSAETIENTLLSVQAQDYTDLEHIIVDGGSTDGTLAIIEKHKGRISKFVSEKDNGLYDALNKGISIASGDIVGILHSDDFYTHNKVISDYARVFTQSGADAVYADLYYVDRQNTDKIIRKWHSGQYQPDSFYFGWMPPHPTFYVKRSVYEKYGKFNTEFRTAADYELMLRFILKEKISIAYLNEFTIKMRVGGKSNVNVGNRVNANLDDRKAWKINGLKPRWYTLYLKPLRKLKQFF